MDNIGYLLITKATSLYDVIQTLVPKLNFIYVMC